MHQGLQKLFEGLNEPQRQAVVHTDGPLLILAGPGSGKTRVVTRRAAHLACTVTIPRHILAITFTNKAAREMRERIDQLGVAAGMTVSTFHAFCARLLREYHDRLGIDRRFTILDRDDRRKMIKQAIERCDLSTSNWPAGPVEAAIGHAKNAMRSAGEFAESAVDWRDRTIARIYSAYETLLQENNCLDFDDLLMRVARLLPEDKALRGELEHRFRYILIDEYQDTNAAQYAIARLLTAEHQNLCATGDPDQSVYGWRGANIENILTFERDYPTAKVVRLEQNYRSTKRILAAADALIAGNIRRKHKTLWTENTEGASLRVIECEEAEEEAQRVASEISGLLAGGVNSREIAVFYRLNSLSRGIEEVFLRAGIAYQIARGVEFYNRKEIKDVLAYLRVLMNPADEPALLRIMNVPTRGIGATTVERLVDHAIGIGRRLTEMLTSCELPDSLGRSVTRVREFGQLLTKLSKATTLPPAEALEFVVSQSGLRAFYKHETEADESATANIDELINAAAEYQESNPQATLQDWLEHTALVSDVDAVKEEGGTVTLMTLHAAKGLEFAHVFIIGLEDGLLPMRRGLEETVDVEEERRLFFVGITRAKERLTLTRARYRMLRGITERKGQSPFLDELPADQIEWTEPDQRSSCHRVHPDFGELPADIDEWSVGTLVRHPVCGLGQVMSLDRGPRRTHVDVQFKDGSRRSWVLEFAHLERVDFNDVG